MFAFDVPDAAAAIHARVIPLDARHPRRRTRVERRNHKCAICFDAFEDGDAGSDDVDKGSVLACAKCRQAFHGKCIGAWLQRASTCPVCRDAIHHRTLACGT